MGAADSNLHIQHMIRLELQSSQQAAVPVVLSDLVFPVHCQVSAEVAVGKPVCDQKWPSKHGVALWLGGSGFRCRPLCFNLPDLGNQQVDQKPL